MSLKKSFFVFAAIGASALAVTAQASNFDPKRGHGANKAKDRGQSVESPLRVLEDEARRYSRLGDYERDLVRDYYRNDRNCPPGLAKKNNGCLPPGIAKKRYEVGRPIFEDADVYDLPYDLSRRLPRLDDGYGYRLIDGDLGVVELSTLVVLDAIGLY